MHANGNYGQDGDRQRLQSTSSSLDGCVIAAVLATHLTPISGTAIGQQLGVQIVQTATHHMATVLRQRVATLISQTLVNAIAHLRLQILLHPGPAALLVSAAALVASVRVEGATIARVSSTQLTGVIVGRTISKDVQITTALDRSVEHRAYQAAL